MSKLIYPSNGLYANCKRNIESCTENLSTAAASCSFDIPSGFSNRSFLLGLRATLNKYRSESNDIGITVRRIDNNYQDLSDSLENSANKLVAPIIKERERLIK